jgi:hypothetical protein
MTLRRSDIINQGLDFVGRSYVVPHDLLFLTAEDAARLGQLEQAYSATNDRNTIKQSHF